MKRLKIKKGHQFRITGQPSQEAIHISDSPVVAVLPDKIAHIKPRLKITQGQPVKIGSVLFNDKRNADFRFLSPACGTIKNIQFGRRRSVKAIEIQRSQKDESHIDFGVIAEHKLPSTGRKELISRILEGGLWWIFRELPIRNMPEPESEPPMILVGLDTREPFQPSPAVYLQDQTGFFHYGLNVLKKLANGNVVVYSDQNNRDLPEKVKSMLTHTIQGNYPCSDPGTVHFHIKRSAKENRAWFTNGQDVVLLGKLLSQGRYPTSRIVCVGGPAAPVRKHFQTRTGVGLSHLLKRPMIRQNVRYMVGGVMTGYTSDANGYMGLMETSLTMLPEGDSPEFLALFNPGYKKPTYSRTFLSRLNPGSLSYTCNLNGARRACIGCMHCADICPVDILPQMTYKAILAQEVEEYLEHGLLDCVECGLCSYVCPSKIELSQTFKQTKAAYAKQRPAAT
ncbi:MAG: 4Fe-4S dicluster domain-containing protein [Desulfobacteraceae bacterium]|nr:4Fe-4S dicluster domain-containing protein [Desulfobacteraceae bacterium]